jgi:aspartokinase/homoserine dehydrogenase 1
MATSLAAAPSPATARARAGRGSRPGRPPVRPPTVALATPRAIGWAAGSPLPAAPTGKLARRPAASPAVSAPSSAAATAPTSTTPFPRGPHWEIHKFGGTCVSAAERIREAAAYILDRHAGRAAEGGATAVVVSAMGSHPSSPVKV